MPTDIQVEILEDGTISTKPSEISDANHISADELLSEIAEMAGGKVIREANPDNPARAFFKNKKVQRGGRIVKTGG